MPATLPRSVREALGADAAEDLDSYFHALLREHTIDPSEYRADMAEVKTRLGALERGHTELRQEIGGLRQEMKQEIGGLRQEMHQEIGGLRQEIGDLRQEMRQEVDGLRQEMHQEIGSLRQEMHDFGREMNTRLDKMQYQMLVQTRWLIGAVSLFGTIIAILLAIGQLS